MAEHDDTYVGEGIRKMKGYKCSLPYDKLVSMKQKFWTHFNKTIPKYVFQAIRNACEFEPRKLKALQYTYFLIANMLILIYYRCCSTNSK